MGILQKHEKLPKNEYEDLLRPVDCIVENHLSHEQIANVFSGSSSTMTCLQRLAGNVSG
jgi:hypothetical protein